MAVENKQKTIVTPEFRLAFPAVFVPEKAPGKEVAQYGIVMLYPKTTDLTPLRALAMETFVARWPAADKRPKAPKNPFRDGDEVDWLGFAGSIVVKAKSLYPPGVVDAQCQPIVKQDLVYPGCWCRAQIGAFAYDQQGNQGVSFNLYNLQLVRDDTPFYNKPDPAKAFTPVAGGPTDSTATQGQKEVDPFAVK